MKYLCKKSHGGIKVHWAKVMLLARGVLDERGTAQRKRAALFTQCTLTASGGLLGPPLNAFSASNGACVQPCQTSCRPRGMCQWGGDSLLNFSTSSFLALACSCSSTRRSA